MALFGGSIPSSFSTSSAAPSRRLSFASSDRGSIASRATTSSITFASSSTDPLRPYHAFPCVWAYEADARNRLLVCSREAFERLRDDAALRLRQQADDLAYDSRLRRRAGLEIDVLGDQLRDECKRFRERIDEAERLLTDPLAAASDVDGGAAGTALTEGGDDTAREKKKKKRSSVSRPDPGELNRFWIAAVDPPITFVNDFRGEVVDTLYNVGQTWTFSFGSWYYRQKRWFFNQSRWRRVYHLTQIENLAVSQELLMGVLNAVEQITVYPAHDAVLSDLEVAVCLLAAYRAALEPSSSQQSGTVDGILLDCSRAIKSLSDDVAAEVPPTTAGAPSVSFFAYRDPSGMKFYAPVQQGRRYAPGTFDEHVLVNVFIRRGVIGSLPGSARLVSRDVSERMTGASKDDLLALWTLRLFGQRLGGVSVPIIAAEQHYLRSGLTALTALLLLWKILNSESVFVAGRAGRFSLKDVFPDGLSGASGDSDIGDSSVNSSSSSSDVGEEGFSARTIKNFEFLLERYVVPWYVRDPTVTLSQLFPGLVLLAYCESHRSGWDLGRRSVESGDGSVGGSTALHVQPSRINPLLDYMMLQASASSDRDVERLAAHDYALFHYENGLGRFLSTALPRHRVLAVGGQLFNVQSVYDCLYFFVLGFLPVINVT